MSSSALLGLALLILSCSEYPPPVACEQHGQHRQTYIVHVHKPPPEHTGSHRDWHESFLPSSRDDGEQSPLVYSYGHVLSGFAARLTYEELEAMRNMPGFVHAEPDGTVPLATTHTPSFLGLNRGPTGFWGKAGYGKGVIIGMLDTGIAPTHPSFNDEGMPPPPARWKGKCEFANASLCNNKLIGAKSFNHSDPSSRSPFDDGGHGTHTASTAAGRFVANASLMGSAFGTAAGMAPDAYIASYKVCGLESCQGADVLAGMDAAVADGVDVISMSIGGTPTPIPLHNDSIAIAAFGAVKKGVFVSASGDNKGPSSGSVRNTAPWFLTVGASTVDRKIRAVVKLGNGVELEGESAYQPTQFSSSLLLPLVYPLSEKDENASLCTNLTSLVSIGVKGKMVLCDPGIVLGTEKGKVVKAAGGVAMIVMGAPSRGYDTYAEAHVIPASEVSYADGLRLLNYLNATKSPRATIRFKGTSVGGRSAPAVAAFSSRGPSTVNPGVLKPDIIGPGVNILAAYPFPVGAFPLTPAFNMISGTSMSCPHLSGIAALLRGRHPQWSPAMIKSAIMTTADTTNLSGEFFRDQWQNTTATFYDVGAGHVNPLRADNPGLVYDIQTDDYIAYLCSLNYTDAQVTMITHDRVNCSNYPVMDEASLNYPSFAVALANSADSVKQVTRTLTNVEEANSSYIPIISRPPAVTLTVKPETLEFTDVGEKKSFTITFGINSTEASVLDTPLFSEGYLTWVSSDGATKVTSPVSVTIASS